MVETDVGLSLFLNFWYQSQKSQYQFQILSPISKVSVKKNWDCVHCTESHSQHEKTSLAHPWDICYSNHSPMIFMLLVILCIKLVHVRVLVVFLFLGTEGKAKFNLKNMIEVWQYPFLYNTNLCMHILT